MSPKAAADAARGLAGSADVGAAEGLESGAARIAELEAALAAAQQQQPADAGRVAGTTAVSAIDAIAANAAEIQHLR